MNAEQIQRVAAPLNRRVAPQPCQSFRMPWRRKGWRLVLALWLGIGGLGGGLRAVAGSDASVKAALERVELGDFLGADRMLGEALAGLEGGDSGEERRRLEFERERLRRIRRDYSLTQSALLAALEAALKDFREEEFDRWLKEGCFDARTIDGETRYFVSSVSNLFFRRPELGVRRVRVRDPSALQRAYLENARAIRLAARAASTPYVLPKRFQVRMSVNVRAGSVVPGEKVLAWLPVPRRFPHQGEFELMATVPGGGRVAPEESPIRSVYLEGVGAADGSAGFEAVYSYVAQGVSFDLAGSRGFGSKSPISAAELEPYRAPGPHVEFTDAMRRLAKDVGAEERDLVARARLYYEWIAREVRYSYAPEYSTIRNLSEACRATGRGDCGQAALLLMTLCRISGIPARWQSGWAIFPGDETIHDWCELYFEPWGWVPVDPYMGMYAMQYADTLSSSQKEELRNFYFGGMTQYRMAANADHGQALWPTKPSVRSDDVDFQRGEVEAGGKNLYFDQFRYDLKWEEIPKP